LRGVNERVLGLLRRAVAVQDGPTVAQVLAQWRASTTAGFRLFDQSADHTAIPAASSGAPDVIADLRDSLVNALDFASNLLDAMRLRLLMTAVHRDWELTPHELSGGPADGRNPVVDTILSGLPTGRLWHVLPIALDQAKQHDRLHWRQDGEFEPSGVVITGDAQPVSRLCEVFILALLVRPELIDAAEPDRQFAHDQAEALRVAARTAVGQRSAWLERYGVNAAQTRQRSRKIIAVISDL